MSLIGAAGRWVGLGLLFAKELALSVWAVIGLALRRRFDFHSAILAVPLDVRSGAGITLLADMITLTPGTTSLHVSDDERTLYVHVMDCSDPEATIRSIKDGFESRVREVLR